MRQDTSGPSIRPRTTSSSISVKPRRPRRALDIHARALKSKGGAIPGRCVGTTQVYWNEKVFDDSESASTELADAAASVSSSVTIVSRGKESTARVPPPGRSSRRMRPPCRTTMRWASARPSPTPPRRPVAKGWKRRSRISGGRPRPAVLDGERDARPPLSSMRRSTGPSRPASRSACAALCSRLRSARSRSCGSPRRAISRSGAEDPHLHPGERRIGGGAPSEAVERELLHARACPAARRRGSPRARAPGGRLSRADLGEEVGDRLLVRPALDQGQVAAQGGEAVAQLVGDAAGHLAEAGEVSASRLSSARRRTSVRSAKSTRWPRTPPSSRRRGWRVRPSGQGAPAGRAARRTPGAAAPARSATAAASSSRSSGWPAQHLGERRPRLGRRDAEQLRAHGVERQHAALAVEQQEAALQARRERALEGGDVVLGAPPARPARASPGRARRWRAGTRPRRPRRRRRRRPSAGRAPAASPRAPAGGAGRRGPGGPERGVDREHEGGEDAQPTGAAPRAPRPARSTRTSAARPGPRRRRSRPRRRAASRIGAEAERPARAAGRQRGRAGGPASGSPAASSTAPAASATTSDARAAGTGGAAAGAGQARSARQPVRRLAGHAGPASAWRSSTRRASALR